MDPATLMKNFQQSELNQNTNISEAYDQLNLKLQEMLDRCAPEKIKRTEKPPLLWFNHTLCKQQKIVKNRERTSKKYKQQHPRRHILWKEIDTFDYSITSENNQLIRKFWTARRVQKRTFPPSQ